MNRVTSGLLAGAAVALLSGAVAHAQVKQLDRERAETRALNQQQLRGAEDGTPVYGSQLMTPEERLQYRDRMRAARTAEEREQIRREHHAEMQARAKERGMTLPDEPPMMGGGMGPGRGMGPGMGQGMGPGMGMGTGPGPGPGAGPGMGRGMGQGRAPMGGGSGTTGGGPPQR
jgi:hypothetical protein